MKSPENIVFKVVSKRDRGSCIIPEYNKKYHLHYEKGEIVTAPENSYGVMCFETEEYAKYFCGKEGASRLWDIITVRGIGKPFHPSVLCWEYDSYGNINKFYRMIAKRITRPGRYDSNMYMSVPMGTVCFPRVMVLE